MNIDPLLMASELWTLEKCVRFPNLSVASEHIGISQPQLSRTISKIEAELDVTLLDRSSRRQSRWTQAAHALAEDFQHTRRQFRDRLYHSIKESELYDLKIGCLEGLSPLASDLAERLFEEEICSQIEIHVLDLNELSTRFSAGEIDILFTSREVGRAKYPVHRTLGYQRLVPYSQNKTDSSYIVLSPTEKTLHPEWGHLKSKQHRLITNSLWLRQHWVRDRKAIGQLPSKISPQRPRSRSKREIVEAVFLIASEKLNDRAQSCLQSFDPFPDKD